MNTATFTNKTSIVHFETLEQTLRLRLVLGHVDKKFLFGIACLVQ